LESAIYGGRRYERLVRLNCEHFNREKETRERFVLVCPTDGPLARVPVFIEYQPKWWFKASGVTTRRCSRGRAGAGGPDGRRRLTRLDEGLLPRTRPEFATNASQTRGRATHLTGAGAG